MGLAQVFGDEEPDAVPAALTHHRPVGVEHRVQRPADRLGAEVVLVLEMAVEGAGGEAGLLHDLVHRRAVDAAALQEGAGGVEDLLAQISRASRAALPRLHLATFLPQ